MNKIRTRQFEGIYLNRIRGSTENLGRNVTFSDVDSYPDSE